MSAVSTPPAQVTNTGTREVIVGFSPEALRAPFLLRCGALIIDYIVVISIPVIGLLLSRFSGNDGAKLLNEGISSASWLVALLVGITNIVLLPMFSGQTIGKIVTGLRIVRIDGTAPPIGVIALRQTAGYFLTLASVGLGFFLSVFSSKGRALHDYISGTVVIYADRRVRR
ncbi:MAG: RDD family protein [Pyrinomonadaceae bacterium]